MNWAVLRRQTPIMSEYRRDQAKLYSETSGFQKEDGLKLISSVKFHDGMKILDLGCGTGYLTSVLATKVGQTGQVIGIDPDKARIALAQKAYGSINNLIFQEGDAAEGIPGGNYDVVFSNYVIHWIKDKKRAFENVFHCLKSGGRFVLTFTTGLSPFLVSCIDNLMPPSRVNEVLMQTLFQLPLDEIVEIASISGFTILCKQEGNRVVRFENFDCFEEAAHSSCAGLLDTQYMDAEKLQKFKQTFGSGEVKDVIPLGSCIFAKDP